MLIESGLTRDPSDLIARVAALAAQTIPAGSRVLVAGHHPDLIGRLSNLSVLPFPLRDEGKEPSGDLAAWAQLLVLRDRGAAYLLIPQNTLWWLDYCADFARHLERRFRRVLAREDACFVYDLHQSPEGDAIGGALQRLFADFALRFNREPAILDWETGLELASRFPTGSIVSPLTRGNVLPYLDGTFDIVATADPVERVREARRVAVGAVALVRCGDESEAAAIDVDWVGPNTGGVPSVSIVVRSSGSGTADPIASLRETLSSDFPVRLVRDACALSEEHQSEIVVFIDDRWLPLDGWLPPLVRLFQQYPDAGVVGGKLIGAFGDFVGAGHPSDVRAQGRGADTIDVDAPKVGYVRPIDRCASAFLATRTDLLLRLHGHDRVDPPGEEYCEAVLAEGMQILYQPMSAVVDSRLEVVWPDSERVR
jgi:hypothetical protein